MPNAARPALVGLAVVVVAALVLGLLARGAGASVPLLAVVVPVVLVGVTVAGAVARLAGNRGERRLDGAERAAALALEPPPGAALLVLIREGFAGRALGVDVTVDGRTAVQLRSPRAAVLPVAPGSHAVAAVIPNAEGARAGEPLRLDVAPGDVAFATVRLTMGAARNTVAVQRADDPDRQRARLASTPLVAPAPDWSAGPAGTHAGAHAGAPT